MSTLWNRYVAIDIGQPGQTGRRVGTGDNGEQGLDIEAMVKMTDAAEPNNATVTIWGVADPTIAAVQEPGAVVVVYAGHLGRNGEGVYRQIFVGRPVPGGVTLKRNNAERALVIEARDDGGNYSAFASLSYSQEVTATRLAEDLFSLLGYSLGTIDIPEVTFPPGYVAHGRAWDELQRLGSSIGRRVQLRDGAIYITAPRSTTGETAIVFSPSAGNLVSVAAKGDGVQITGLLAPDLRPSMPCVVRDAAKLNGNYRATDVVHDITTDGRDFYTTVTARAL